MFGLKRPCLAIASGLALVAGGVVAHAQQAPNRIYIAAPSFTTTGSPTSTSQTLEWDPKKGRWGLKLGVEQHLGRDGQWTDMQPGVFYKITPRFHIGGAVSLAPEQIQDPRLLQSLQPAKPRVRLETIFKF
jgi:hypothetical protein